MENIKPQVSFVADWNNITDKHIEVVSQFIASEKVICQEYDESKRCHEIEKHNVFRIISDLYYRENFHSDLLCYFLNPKEKHKCGNLFLSAFIKMINKCGANISISDYFDAEVSREQGDIDHGRIDILVLSKSCNKAIVIENKIHDAPDMQRQLPKYYDYVTDILGYTIDAIVYIPLDVAKKPDKSDWTESDKLHVNDSVLKIIPAYCDKTKVNLVSDWLEPAAMLADQIDVISTLRQYLELIKHLNYNFMDTIIMEKFYNELLKSENFKSAQSIRNMMNELPLYMVNRIIKRYEGKCAPFQKINNYRNYVAYFGEDSICEVSVKINITCSESGYNVSFLYWGNEEPSDVSNYEKLAGRIRCLDDSIKDANDAYKNFDFTNEKGMFAFVDELLKELSALSGQSRE